MSLRPVLITLLWGTSMLAQNAGMLVSTEWLAERLQDPKIAVLHVGTKTDYENGHIAGARLVSLADISVIGERGLRLQLPSVDALRETFGKLGVSGDSRVVVCAGTDSVQSATRVWFTLDYLGLGERASLLDGGLAAWRAENRPLSTEPVQAAQATFTPKPRPELVVDAAWIQSQGPARGFALVDARLPEFYTGANVGAMPRGGHIPGAVNVPFSTLLERDGKLKHAALLKKLLPEGKPLVTYCHIGQQATVAYFAARYLGLDVKLYDGSFQDWSMRSELPVEGSSK